MPTYKWNDGLLSGSRRSRLYLIKGQIFHKFCGAMIPEFCAIVSESFQKNGKWSNTSYVLELAPMVRAVEMCSPLHGIWGNYFNSWHECAEHLQVPVDMAKLIVKQEYPSTANRLDEIDEFMKTVQCSSHEEESTECALSWKDDESLPILVKEGVEYPFSGKSIQDVVIVLKDQSCHYGYRKYQRNSYWVVLLSGVKVKK